MAHQRYQLLIWNHSVIIRAQEVNFSYGHLAVSSFGNQRNPPLCGSPPPLLSTPIDVLVVLTRPRNKLSKLGGNLASLQCTVDTMHYLEQPQISGEICARSSIYSQDIVNRIFPNGSNCTCIYVRLLFINQITYIQLTRLRNKPCSYSIRNLVIPNIYKQLASYVLIGQHRSCVLFTYVQLHMYVATYVF